MTFKIDVFGREVEVRVVSHDHTELSDCIANCDMKEQVIHISERLLENKRVFGQVLFHEIWHALRQWEREEDMDANSLMMYEFLWDNQMIDLPRDYYDAQIGEF